VNDLEICKRIAEIEGKTGHEFMGVFVLSENFNEAVNESHSNSYSFSVKPYAYNPLSDDALCFKFAVDGKMELQWTECPAGTGKAYFVNVDVNSTDYCDTPNRAVCMAKLGIFKWMSL